MLVEKHFANPLNFEDEMPEDADMRRMFFDAIDSELKKRD